MTTTRQVDVTVNLLQGSTLSPTAGIAGGVPGLASAAQRAVASTPFGPAPAGSNATQGFPASFDRFAQRALLLLHGIAQNTGGAPGGGGHPAPAPRTGLDSSWKKGGKDVLSGLSTIDQVPNGLASSWQHLAAGTPAADTLARSVRALGLTVANILTPGLVRASFVVQDVTHWIDGLDPKTKAVAGTFASWAGAAIGTGLAINLVGSAIRPLTGLVTGANTVMTGLATTFGVSRLAMFGWVGVAAAVVTSVGIMTNGFGLLNDNLERTARAADEAIERIERLRGGGDLTRRDYNAVPANLRTEIEGAAPGDRRRIIERQIESLQGRRDQLMAQNPSAMQARIEAELQRHESTGFMDTVNEHVTGSLQARRWVGLRRATGLSVDELGRRLPGTILAGATLGPDSIRQVAGAASGSSEATTLESTLQSLRRVLQSGVPGIFAGSGPQAGPRGGPQAGLGGADGHMISQQIVPPQLYGSGTQLYESMLTEAIGKTEQEIDIQRRIMEGVEALVREAQNQGEVPTPAPRRGG